MLGQGGTWLAVSLRGLTMTRPYPHGPISSSFDFADQPCEVGRPALCGAMSAQELPAKHCSKKIMETPMSCLLYSKRILKQALTAPGPPTPIGVPD